MNCIGLIRKEQTAQQERKLFQLRVSNPKRLKLELRVNWLSMGGYLAESHLNEETFKVIHDAERGIGLFGPFDSVDEMLESLLDEGDD